MRVPHGSTILVADGRKRLIARNEGSADAPDLKIVNAAEAVTPRTHDIATDAAGRSPAGAGGSGGAPVETTDPHDHEEEQFAVATAAMLRDGVADGRYEELIIVAAPRTLGVLRKHYHDSVKERVIEEIGKDFTGQPIDAVTKMLIAH